MPRTFDARKQGWSASSKHTLCNQVPTLEKQGPADQVQEGGSLLSQISGKGMNLRSIVDWSSQMAHDMPMFRCQLRCISQKLPGPVLHRCRDFSTIWEGGSGAPPSRPTNGSPKASVPANPN